jgi:serine/threonine protein phosphatase PrpC
MSGEDIGPKRVWLLSQDVPGLAMTRSFGDMIAASVGVLSQPEVWKRKIEPDDAFFVLASDGVWEFIENQPAVDIIVKASCAETDDAKRPMAAVTALTDESTRLWKNEEEVIDDITAVIAYLRPPPGAKAAAAPAATS